MAAGGELRRIGGSPCPRPQLQTLHALVAGSVDSKFLPHEHVDGPEQDVGRAGALAGVGRSRSPENVTLYCSRTT
ncbi:hypothetical protein GUJ93_ZPchr0009g2371 [Zizania palustris]|uniref:Uncharacterized protein n=1 Tax=Zizania palustris TaxID=103762 RepID=A0A8J5RAH4_ZIZPA|nr:hypothetical protein GUJ93_ZPchr0009g2371 [Zizania palustris]